MRTAAEWLRQISALAELGLRGTDLAASLQADADQRLAAAKAFADDFGHRRAVDPPLLAWVFRVQPWLEPRDPRVDILLWHALHDPAAFPSLPPQGPLSPASREQGIEVWTEIELASLQALWWHARHEPALLSRAHAQARWLMDELQPDNGTNRPWAAATFAELAAAGDADASLYADTLLHNCQVSLGKPDLLSTVLLVDARRRLAEAVSGEASQAG